MEFINGKDDIPYIMTIMENNPAMFETTNQVNTFFVYHLFADTKKMSLWNTQSGHRCLHFVALRRKQQPFFDMVAEEVLRDEGIENW